MRQLVFGLVFLGVVADANAAGFCGRTPADIRAEAWNPDTHMGFSNHGGLANGGVCWWHSRFQRASLYLAEYAPREPKPFTREQVTDLVRRLARTNQVVKIPGYKNLRDFSSDWGFVIQKRLELWQIQDGLLKFAWINGLAGRTHESTSKLESRLAALYEEVEGRNRIVWQKLQIPGIPAHAWLVVGVNRKGSGYYSLDVIDSNAPRAVLTIEFAPGDDRLWLPYGIPLVPYTGNEGDLGKIEAAIQKRCG